MTLFEARHNLARFVADAPSPKTHVRWTAVRSAWPLAVAAAVGAAWFSATSLGVLVNPTHLEPVVAADWSTHAMGFLTFRNESLQLPLGRLEGLLSPLGTTVGMTDSIPLLCVLLRPLASLLPVDFQFIGLWLLFCFMANGGGAALALRWCGATPWVQAAGGALLALSPIFLERVGHPALCFHLPLILLVGLNLRPLGDAAQARRALVLAAVLVAITCAVHPYLAGMTTALALALVLRVTLVEAVFRRWWVVPLGAAIVSVAAGVSWLFGYVGSGVISGQDGFGAFSADPLTFFSPDRFSRFFSPAPRGHQQYEGYAFLGLGGLLALGVAGVSAVVKFRDTRELPWRRAAPLLVIAVGMFVFACSNVVTMRGQTVLDLRSATASLTPYVAPFRSSGRFVWPLFYVVSLGALVLLTRVWARRAVVAGALATLCAVAQAAELNPGPTQARLQPTMLHRFRHPTWELLTPHFRHLEVIPAEIYEACVGPWGYRNAEVISLQYYAYRHRLTFNSGYVARHPQGMKESCAAQEQRVRSGALDADTLYVVTPEIAEALHARGEVCAPLEWTWVCVKRNDADEFSRALAATR